MVQLTFVGYTDGNADLVDKGFSVNGSDDDGRFEGNAVLFTTEGSGLQRTTRPM